MDHENRAHHMFPHDVIPHMFSNVKSIYKLHHDFLLPQLEERMAQWERNRRIGELWGMKLDAAVVLILKYSINWRDRENCDLDVMVYFMIHLGKTVLLIC